MVRVSSNSFTENCAKIRVRCIPPMSPSSPPLNEDLTNFARYLGLDGVDADLFYEQYYDLDNEEYEMVFDHDYDAY